MLRTRIITALVLMAFLVPALHAGGLVWAVFCGVFVLAGQWEWNRLILAKQGRLEGDLPTYVIAGAVMAVLLVFAYPYLAKPQYSQTLAWAYLAASALWLAVLGSRLRTPIKDIRPQLWEPLVFLLALWAAVVSLQAQGLMVLFSALGLVWIADIGAYFAGKAFGKRKLAPVISPGKSWEGAWGGAVCVVLLGLIWIYFFAPNKTISGRWSASLSLVGALAAGLAVCAISVMGDLSESQLKRASGYKDSSQLLPGHGGVFDRVDALIPSIPFACGFLLAVSSR